MTLRFLEFITELFDKPWSLENVNGGDMHEFVKKELKDKYPNYSRLTVYKATDDKGNHKGHVIEFAHNGAMEIHHSDENDNSGVWNISNKPNTKFIGTMKKRVIYHANEKSHKVRLVGRKDMIKQYHKIGKRLIDNHKDLTISEISKHDHPYFKDVYEFIVKPKDKFGLDEYRKQK